MAFIALSRVLGSAWYLSLLAACVLVAYWYIGDNRYIQRDTLPTSLCLSVIQRFHSRYGRCSAATLSFCACGGTVVDRPLTMSWVGNAGTDSRGCEGGWNGCGAPVSACCEYPLLVWFPCDAGVGAAAGPCTWLGGHELLWCRLECCALRGGPDCIRWAAPGKSYSDEGLAYGEVCRRCTLDVRRPQINIECNSKAQRTTQPAPKAHPCIPRRSCQKLACLGDHRHLPPAAIGACAQPNIGAQRQNHSPAC